MRCAAGRRHGSDVGKSVVAAGLCRWLAHQVAAALDTDFAAVREARLDRLADLTTRHLDTTVLSRLITDGPPASMPLVPPREAEHPACRAGRAISRRLAAAITHLPLRVISPNNPPRAGVHAARIC